MRGTEAARKVIAARLAEALPARLVAVETRLGLDPGTIPPPALIATPDRPRIEGEEWPALFVVSLGAPRLRRVELDEPGSTVFERAYSLRVYIYVRSQSFEEVADLRDRYVLAVVETLLGRQALGDDRIEETSLAQTDSEILPDSIGRSVGGAYVDFEFRLSETLEYVPLGGPVEGIEVVGAPLT